MLEGKIDELERTVRRQKGEMERIGSEQGDETKTGTVPAQDCSTEKEDCNNKAWPLIHPMEKIPKKDRLPFHRYNGCDAHYRRPPDMAPDDQLSQNIKIPAGNWSILMRSAYWVFDSTRRLGSVRES